MIDVVEVSYRVVKVKQQKYRCACGGCIGLRPASARRKADGTLSTSGESRHYIDHPLARQGGS
ncbi:MAG: hypothetical protein U0270_11050 [Labilithrix sp.]